MKGEEVLFLLFFYKGDDIDCWKEGRKRRKDGREDDGLNCKLFAPLFTDIPSQIFRSLLKGLDRMLSWMKTKRGM